MANGIKYSQSVETSVLRKGDFYLLVGDVAKGTTVATGFWNGSDLNGVKYIIYLNKTDLGPSIYAPIDDADLIVLTNKIAGANYSTAGDCIAWFATQPDKMVINKTYAPILTDGLLYMVDASFLPSYSTQGNTALDISTNANTLNILNGTTFNSNGYFVTDGVDDYLSSTNPSSINTIGNSDPFTFSVLFKLTQYANQRLSDAENYSSLLMKSSYSPSFGISMRYDLPSGGVFTRARTYSGVRNTTIPSGNPGYGQPSLTSSGSFSLNRWYQVDFTSEFSGTSYFFKTYINGALDSTTTRTDPNYPVSYQNTGNLTSGTSPLAGNGVSSPLNISRSMIYNKALSLSEIQQNYYQAPIVTDGLVLAMDAGNLISFESGSTTAYSMVGAVTGALTNGVGYSTQNSGTWTFDGADDWINFGNSLDSLVNLSLECWINPGSQTTSFTGLISKTLNNSDGWEIRTGFNSSSTQTFVQFRYKGDQAPTGVVTLNNNQWYHLIATGESGSQKLYVNGVVSASNTSSNTPTPNSNNLSIGKLAYSGLYFNGKIPIARIYNRVLTQEEVSQNFNAQRSRFAI